MQCLLLEDSENFFLAHDQELFAIELDLGAGVLAEQDAVTGLYIEREHFALIVRLALADRDDLALLWLLFCGIGDDDAATDAFALFNTANQDPIV